jgi:hypothetical protein
MVARRLERRRLADATELAGVLLGRAVRYVVARGVRHAQRKRVAVLLGPCERLLGLPELGLDGLEHLELLGRRLALHLRARPQLVDPWDE